MFLTLAVIVFAVTLYTSIYFTRYITIIHDCDSIEKMGEEHLITDDYNGVIPFTPRMVKKAISRMCRIKEFYDEEIIELVPASNKLFDNLYVFERQYAEIRHNKAEKYLKKMPALLNTTARGIPRLYAIARNIVCNQNVLANQETLTEYISRYISKQSITIDEIRLLILTIKMAFIEKFIYLSRKTEAELESKRYAQILLAKYMETKNEDIYKKNINDISFMSYFLYKINTEETELMENIKSTYNKDIFETENRKQTELIEEFLEITGAFSELAEINSEKLFLSLSPVNNLFLRDPENIYEKLDFETKDNYHSSIVRLSKKLKISERETALKVLSSCRKGHDRQ